METAEHWEKVYATKRSDQVSWYQPHLDLSLRMIADVGREHPDVAIIDVGGGESTLVDDLFARGYTDLTVLDLSKTAIEVTKQRIGADAGRVTWLHGDVTTLPLPERRFDVWHDRAVFHFLTQPADRVAYVRQVARSVKIGGRVIIATFGPEGPAQCSGLDVVRYDGKSLHDEFGPRFTLIDHVTEIHRTPWGAVQQFMYCYCDLVG